ncbi:hypothetical protein [Brevundimonas sp. TWP2-3-4b2]|uniref:tetratricopeptide repeat protein n=1 Tax=Brevundimonas sp. TWP2-3-4b2 TaxID=2804595 RepID=UPI003CF020F7
MAARSGNRRPVVRMASLALTIAVALGAGVTAAGAQDFEAVLAAPDDEAVNLAYAREQARSGNLALAASTLERILILQPNRHSVRLFYAVVLFRLGDLQSARDELRRLEAVQLTAFQRAEAESYSRRIDQSSATRSLSGSLNAGVVFENDAAGAYFTAFELIGAPPPEEGMSSEVTLVLDGHADIGAGQTWQIYGTGLLYDHAALSGAAIDFQRAGLEVGLARTTRLSSSRLGAVLRHVRLMGEPQLTEAGVRGDTRWRVTNATTLSLRAEAVSQDYDEPGIDALSGILGGDRDGIRYSAGAGISHRFTSRTTFGANLDYEVKSAGYGPFGYAGPRLGLRLDQRFDKGVYLFASGSARWIEYDEADAIFLGGATRDDIRTQARVALGAPLSAFTARGATGDVRENVTLEGALNYSRRGSSPPLADFDGWGAELRLIWRFGARD